MSDHDASEDCERTYSALRVRSRGLAPAWWTAASERRDAPAAIAPLLGGRTRVEVTTDEGLLALEWAAGVAGWAGADPKPVFLHEPSAQRA